MSKPKLALIGIPWDANSSYMKGPAEAPPKIRNAFHNPSANTWSEQGIDIGEKDLLHDVGDITVSPDHPLEDIEIAISALLEMKIPIITLGGDHTVTYPVIKAFRKNYSSFSILHFDAHPDLYDELDGNRISHACPFARIMEENLADRLVQVGVRTLNGHQREQAKRFGVEILEMKDMDAIPELEFEMPLYISFDLDTLDPAFAPGVSHFEPGGLSTRQAILILQSIKAPSIIGADIVEYNPRRDSQGMTAMVCAKIFKEMAARMTFR